MTRHRTECLKSSLRQPFFGLREICLLGFGWAIFASDNISGCFHCVNSAITVFTLANNLRHWYFASWLNTDGYFLLVSSWYSVPVVDKLQLCSNVPDAPIVASKSFITLNPTSPDTNTLVLPPLNVDLEKDIPLVMVIVLVAFSVRCLFYQFLQEDKLWKKRCYTLICIFIT